MGRFIFSLFCYVKWNPRDVQPEAEVIDIIPALLRAAAVAKCYFLTENFNILCLTKPPIIAIVNSLTILPLLTFYILSYYLKILNVFV